MSEALAFILLMPRTNTMNMKHIIVFLLRLLFLMSLNIAVTLCAGGGETHQFACLCFAGANLTTDGNATVTPDGLQLVLTSSKTNLQGHAFCPTPLQF
jgi:hypothetical protein